MHFSLWKTVKIRICKLPILLFHTNRDNLKLECHKELKDEPHLKQWGIQKTSEFRYLDFYRKPNPYW